MKRLVCIVAILSLSLSLFGCKSNEPPEIPDAANFYYITTDLRYDEKDGFISPERRDVKGSADDLHTLINLYLAGPTTEQLVSPFPANTVVKDITHKNSIFSITLSNEFAKLTEYDLSVACACLTLTIQEFVDSNLVQISAEDAELDGNKHITMNAESIVLFDVLSSAN